MKHKRLWACLLAVLTVVCMSGCATEEEIRQSDAMIGSYDPNAGRDAVQSGISDGTEPVDDDAGNRQDDGIQWNGVVIPAWDGENPYVVLNGNEPFFEDDEKSVLEPFESYSDLDALGRCGPAYANLCIELMPTEERGDIGSVRPSGWHTVRYDGIVSGNYLYNRCHLIGFQLAGENANPDNLITGTRYLNIDGMLGFENMLDEYIEETENHVLYRVTPIYDGEDLVARGVVMEGYSVEDQGSGVCFNVFAYNVQPGVGIDYATGESRLLDGTALMDAEDAHGFVLNTKTGKFHRPDCRYAADISDENRLEVSQTLDKMLAAGYSPCGSCHPDER